MAEVIWIVQGRSDIGFLSAWNSNIVNFLGHGAHTTGAYGPRLRSYNGIDQLERAYAVLRENPDSRQVVLQIWDPPRDLPHKDGTSTSIDIPCAVTSLLKISENTLEWTQILRSNDIIMGLPYNIIQWSMLQEVLAGWLDVQPGNYTQLSDSLHLYDRDRSLFEYGPSHDAHWTYDFRLKKDDSHKAFSALETFAENLLRSESPLDVSVELGAVSELPAAYFALASTLASERVRRLGSISAAVDLAYQNTGGTLRNCLLSWLGRWNR